MRLPSSGARSPLPSIHDPTAETFTRTPHHPIPSHFYAAFAPSNPNSYPLGDPRENHPDTSSQSLSPLTSRVELTLAAMASAGANQPSTAAQSSPQQAAQVARSESAQQDLSSSPVEMKTLPPSEAAPEAANNATPAPEVAAAPAAEIAVPHTTETIPAQSSQAAAATSVKPAPPTNLTRAETEAIGPSTDTPAAVPDSSNGPVLVIMLLLPSTGARHPYKIDERYLKKREVKTEEMDPYNITVNTLKELIWRDWREGMSRIRFLSRSLWIRSWVEFYPA